MAFLSDTFTDTNGTNLEAHTGELGATWTNHPSYTASAKIQTNRVYPNAGLRTYYASGVPASADYDVEGVIRKVTAANAAGIAGRMSTSADTMYLLNWEQTSTRFNLYKIVAGVVTSLGTFTDNPATGTDRTARLVMRGTSIKALIDGTERISVTDSDITAAGRAGMRVNGGTSSTGYHIDSIVAGEPQALAGQSNGVGTQSGALGVAWPLAGASAGVGITSADLVATRPLAGASAGAGANSADLVVAHPLAGTVTGAGAATGDLAVAWVLTGSAAGAGSTQGDLTATFTLAGTSAGVSTASGDLTEVIYLLGTSAGAGATSGDLTADRPLEGRSTGGSDNQATLSYGAALTGSAVGSSTASGATSVAWSLAGDAAGSSTAEAELRGPPPWHYDTAGTMSYGPSSGIHTYAGTATASYGGTALWTYAGDDNPVLNYR